MDDDLYLWPLAEQIFLQLPEVYKSFESRPVVRKTQSHTSRARWHWPSGDRVFTDVGQFRSVSSTKCRTKCIRCSMSALVSDAKFLPPVEQLHAMLKNGQLVHSVSMKAKWQELVRPRYISFLDVAYIHALTCRAFIRQECLGEELQKLLPNPEDTKSNAAFTAMLERM